MNIGIDLDDTIADTFEYIMPFIAEYFNVDLSYVKENNISYNTLLPEMKEKEFDFAKTYYDKVVPMTPFKPNVKEYIDKIRKLGHRIIIITARDNTIYNDPYKATYQELANNNIAYDKLVCSFDKVSVCLDEKIDLFIDDSISNCIKVSNMGIKTLIFDSKLNRDNDTFERVKTWKEVYNYIIKL